MKNIVKSVGRILFYLLVVAVIVLMLARLLFIVNPDHWIAWTIGLVLAVIILDCFLLWIEYALRHPM